jgi:hypothetical protein
MTVNRTAVALLAGAAILLGGAAVFAQEHGHLPPPQITFAAHPQPIPFELFRGNRIVIPARINGRETPVLLDTGASATTVDKAFARSIGLPEGQKIQARGAGGFVDAEIVSGVTLEINGMRFDKMTVAVMDLAPVARSIGGPLNVILGREFFNSAVVSIDWAKSQLRVASADGFRPAAGSASVELGKNGPFNTIPVSVAGAAPINALLDLGNGGALSLPRTYWESRSELTNLKSAGAMTGGVGGLHSARAAIVPQVTLGERTIAQVPTILSDSGNDNEPTQMANVGIELLKQFSVDLDLGHDRIFLTPRTDAPPLARDRAGVRFDFLGDRLKVVFVSPQGPAAAAGLKEGDEVIAVDGQAVTANYYSKADWTRGSVGTTVRLDRTDGSHVGVTLQDYF